MLKADLLLKAARRKAISELLFFASIGDLKRCQRLCRQWNISVSHSYPFLYLHTPLLCFQLDYS